MDQCVVVPLKGMWMHEPNFMKIQSIVIETFYSKPPLKKKSVDHKSPGHHDICTNFHVNLSNGNNTKSVNLILKFGWKCWTSQ